MAKEKLMPHGLPSATPCPDLGSDKSKNTAPANFVPAGIEIQPTNDPLANFLIDTFNNAEVPPPPTPTTPSTPKT
ncbi:MAG: hypothetical protein ACK4FA_00570 [Candidatus Paceibacteria bacterium]